MAELFRDSGFEKIALVATSTGAATLINAPGQDKNIYILGVHTSGNVSLKENDAAGNTIMFVAAGNSNLPSTIKVTANTGIYSSLANVSVFYYID